MLCVGTPGRPNGQLSVEAVERIGEEIGQALKNRTAPMTVVLRSTVLPGTTEQVLAPALRKGGAPGLRIAVNPEFLREGSALRDFSRPPLTLVGARAVRGRPAARPLRRHRGAVRRDDHQVGRDDEVRLELLARAQDRLHQ